MILPVKILFFFQAESAEETELPEEKRKLFCLRKEDGMPALLELIAGRIDFRSWFLFRKNQSDQEAGGDSKQ